MGGSAMLKNFGVGFKMNQQNLEAAGAFLYANVKGVGFPL